jgi:zinc-ribbon domain
VPYCRRCGTKLADDAHFCQKCGTPVLFTYPSPAPLAPNKTARNDPFIIAAIVLITILVGGVVVAVLLTASFATVNINQSYRDNTAGINKLNLNVETQALKVNVFTQNITQNNNFLITLDGTASKGINSGSDSPIQVVFYNDTTVNNELTITAKITQSTVFSRFNINCNIYVNPALTLYLNVTSQAGQVNLTADKPSTFGFLNLQSSAGAVQANFDNITIAGNVTLRTQAGSVDIRMNEVNVEGNNTIDLHTNAGSVTMDITQTTTLQGNLQVNAVTDLGSVNIGLVVDGDVGAKLVSQTHLGSIHVDVQHFSGNQSPLQSDNYPAVSNIEIDSRTNLGSININANYKSSTGPSLRN